MFEEVRKRLTAIVEKCFDFRLCCFRSDLAGLNPGQYALQFSGDFRADLDPAVPQERIYASSEVCPCNQFFAAFRLDIRFEQRLFLQIRGDVREQFG